MASAQTGRPTKLTPEMQRRVADLVRAGNYVETAAACSGISKDTLYRWLKRGARARSGIYRDFAEAVEKAQAESEARDVTLIATAARDQWQAAAWRLERKFPERWGRRERQTLEHVGPGGGPVQIEAVGDAIVEAWRRRQAGETAKDPPDGERA